MLSITSILLLTTPEQDKKSKDPKTFWQKYICPKNICWKRFAGKIWCDIAASQILPSEIFRIQFFPSQIIWHCSQSIIIFGRGKKYLAPQVFVAKHLGDKKDILLKVFLQNKIWLKVLGSEFLHSNLSSLNFVLFEFLKPLICFPIPVCYLGQQHHSHGQHWLHCRVRWWWSRTSLCGLGGQRWSQHIQ